mmetsp:Transcript_4827/g.7245  ORF Transcript_4827/g.7245 Transcript_4827/m.7245 type:complete len:171 (-) Transcript_4827:61-573(-)
MAKVQEDEPLCSIQEECCATLNMVPVPPEISQVPEGVWNEYLSKVIERRGELLPTTCCGWCAHEICSEACLPSCLFVCAKEIYATKKLEESLKQFNEVLNPYSLEGRYDTNAEGCCCTVRGRLEFYQVEIKKEEEQAKTILDQVATAAATATVSAATSAMSAVKANVLKR